MKRKVFSWAFLLLFVASLLATALPAPSKVHAIDRQDILNSLCVPYLQEGTSNVRGWLNVEFINRSVVKFKWSTDGNCAPPNGSMSTEYFSVSGIKFTDLFGSGLALDTNTGDDIMRYERVNGSGKDDTSIYNYDGAISSDPTSGRDQIIDINSAEFKKLLAPGWVLMSWEEDLAKLGPDVCTSTNDNIVLTGRTQKDLKWVCRKSYTSKIEGQTLPYDHYINLENFNISYNVLGAGTGMKIEHVSENQRPFRTFGWSPSTNKFIALKDGYPNGDLQIESIEGRTAYTPKDFESIANGLATIVIKNTKTGKTVTSRVAGPTSQSATIGRTTAKEISNSATNSDSAGTGTPSCKYKLTNPLTWLLCPLIMMAVEGVRQFDAAITHELTIDNRYLDEAGAGAGIYEAWANFRGVALTLLVLIALVMVISQAFSFGPFDAYTIRKVLPRILIAIVGITFSWDLCKFLVEFTNVLGVGIKGIILSPFPGSVEFNLSGGFESILTLGALGAAGAALGIAGLFTFAGTAFLAVIVAFALIVLRKIAIIFLVIFAPLAIIAYILPNTQKYWKFWWESFSKLLLVFPLIMAFIAIGRAVAIVTKDLATVGNNANDLVGSAVIFIGYFGPYFFIPKLFSMAGGAFGAITGMVNDRSRGGFDRLRNARKEIAQERHQKRMEEKGGVLGSKKLGSAYRRAFSFGKNGSLSVTSGGRSRWQQAEMQRRDAVTSKMLEEGGARGLNDDDASELAAMGLSRNKFLEAYQYRLRRNTDGTLAKNADGSLVYETDASGNYVRRNSLEDAQGALARTELAVGARMGSTAMRQAALKFRIAMTNTAYKEGEEGLAAMQQELKSAVKSGLITAVDGAGWMKSNRGRTDYSANSFSKTIDFVAGKISAADQLAGAFEGADPREILGAHQKAVIGFADQALKNYQSAIIDGDQVVIDKTAADLANIHSILSSVSPKKANEWADKVFSQKSGIRGRRPKLDNNGNYQYVQVPDEDNPKRPPKTVLVEEERELTIREYLDVARSDDVLHPAFHDRSREYSSARERMSNQPIEPNPNP